MPSSSASIGSSLSTASRLEPSVAGGARRRPPAPLRRLTQSGSPSRTARRRQNSMPPMIRNGSFGSPGTSANMQITPPATSGALRC